MKLARLAALVGLLLGTLRPASSLAEDLADVSERIFEISPFGGAFRPDSNIRYEAWSPLVGVRAGLNNSAYWGIEAQVSMASGQRQQATQGRLDSYQWQAAFDQNDAFTGFVISDMQTTETTTAVDTQLLMVGGSLVFNLTKKKFRPFLNLGAGFIEDLENRNESPPSPFSNVYADLGFGFKFHRKSGWAWRLDFHDLLMRRDDLPRPNDRAPMLAAQTDLNTAGGADGVIGTEPYDPSEYRAQRWLHNYTVTLSLTFPFGFAWKDGDRDQIEDRFDNCLTTAPGVVVDQIGCGIDTDQDGVFDGLDECTTTPLGATVDLVGCESDSDNDGIFDGLDHCPDTPAGATINLVGCESDGDGDGVLDGLDACDDTPRGATIDDKGCVADPLEGQLLRGELIRVAGIEFESGTARMEPTSYHHLNKISRLLERWTGHEDQPLRVEIGVHTDGVGSEELNLELSQNRADAIRLYMLENYPAMGANNLVAVGYGESMPLAADDTVQGRNINRRVEVRSRGEGDFPEPYYFGDEEPAGDLGEPATPDETVPEELRVPEVERPDPGIED